MISGELARAFVGLVLLTLLLRAAWTDIRSRRIENRVCALIVALWPVHLVLSPVPPHLLVSLAVALAVFAAATAMWRFGWLGGGDVKLLAAVGLWAGPEHALHFLLVTGLAGGALALALLWYRHVGWTLLVPVQAAVASLLPRRAASAAVDQATLPYGIAIAAGGCWLWLRLFAG
ncbi:MAG TPA: prepilin peptidase [Geminicoccaceae bacterium]|nr:prepilin peptidase [Geminicoccus sp.]HMU50029.1 prepilin peptidase [Geminicoccaceae bacterium]